MSLLTTFLAVVLLLVNTQSYAALPLPDANAVAMTISGNCGAFDVARVDRKAYERCTNLELAAYDKVQRLSKDGTIPSAVWNSCWAASSARNADFRLWARCVDVAKSTCSLQVKYVGLGVQWGIQEDNFFVDQVIDDSPMQKAGLTHGDILIKVGTREVSGLSMKQLSELTKGKAGTQIALTFRTHDNDQIRFVNLVRKEIATPDEEGIQNCWIWIQSGKWISKY